MGTNSEPTESDTTGRRYRSHSPGFKRQLVEASYLPGASVARIAQSHGINANQLFAWRKLFREQGGAFGPSSEATFLPVTLDKPSTAASASVTAPAPDSLRERSDDRMEVAIGKSRLTIHGSPDAALVRAVLETLLQ